MNATQIQTAYKSILQLLSAGQLAAVFEKTNELAQELQIGEYSDKLSDIQHNYRLLLQYYVSGADDPQRKLVYNKIIAKLFILNADLREELLVRNSSTFEYTQKRYFPYSRHFQSIADIYQALRYFHSQTELLLGMPDVHQVELRRLRRNYEDALRELFMFYWLETRYSNEQKNIFATLLLDQFPGWIEKTLLVSALTLSLWRTFDENKLVMLFDATNSSDARVKQRALVGLCFVLARYNRFLLYFPLVRNRLVLLADDNHVVENFNNIIIQIIGTTETEKISKKMRDEILPEMMKISPEIRNKMENDNFSQSDEWNDENPEWSEMLEDSGISDKLKELSELQQEGADVYMSTFSLLKNFPFFELFSNWFLPFDSSFTDIHELFSGDDNTMLNAFVNNNVMCNSDKYSFCLSILQMPESQRALLKQSFRMETEQLDEMARDEALLKPDLMAKNISKQYIQDLFRIFKLHPHRADFDDLFLYSLLMHRTVLFEIMGSNPGFKESVAEYYFSKGIYQQALDLYGKLLEDQPSNASLYQKIGYCYQQTSQLDLAFDAYSKADIIQPDDLWTLKKMAFCSRMSANYSQALDCYQHVNFLKPNQRGVEFQIGNCFMELGKYKEALSVFFKLDALGEEDVRVWRAIVWCSFLFQSLDQAAYYSDKIMTGSPEATDALNAGHIALCRGNRKQAMECYQKSIQLFDDRDKFMNVFRADKKYLLLNGLDADEIPLLTDVLSAKIQFL